ncbi:MAG: hypothetical protein R3C26_11605 [Calditrichia bacterium]
MSSMLKKCSTFFLMLFIASCAGTKLIQPESQKDASYQQAQLTNTRLAIVMLDSLQITYDRDIKEFPVQRYRYYLKRQFPVAIRENTVFKDAALVYSIDNAADIQWKTESLPRVETGFTIPVPALSTRFDLPGGDYPFVLILSRLDIQHTGKNIRSIDGCIDVSATGCSPNIVCAMCYGMIAMARLAERRHRCGNDRAGKIHRHPTLGTIDDRFGSPNLQRPHLSKMMVA